MSAKFEKAVSIVQNMPKDGVANPTQAEQLQFYGLYKQANNGDVDTTRPGMLDFTGKAKWDAWKANEGLSQDEAKTKYVEALQNVLQKHTDDADVAKWLAELESA